MTDLMTTLRQFDPAAGETMTTERRIGAEAALARILDDPGQPADQAPGRVREPARRTRRALLAAACTLVLGSGFWAAHASSAPDAAYASWTPTAQRVDDADLGRAGDACRRELGDPWRDRAIASVMLAERRGKMVFVVFAHREFNLFAGCLVKLPPGAHTATVDGWGIGGNSGGPPVLAPRELEYVTGVMGGRIRSVAGFVGADVRAVTVRSGKYTMQATVQNGRFVAWWPGTGSRWTWPWDDSTPTWVPITYDLTLVDGTVLHDVPDGMPRSR